MIDYSDWQQLMKEINGLNSNDGEDVKEEEEEFIE